MTHAHRLRLQPCVAPTHTGGTTVADLSIALDRRQGSQVRTALREEARAILRDRLEGMLWLCVVATALTVVVDLAAGKSILAPPVLVKVGGTVGYFCAAIVMRLQRDA